MNIADRILNTKEQAKAAGIPTRRLYLGAVKLRELGEWCAEQNGTPYADPTGATFAGMKIVASKQPGMSIGQ